MPTGLQQALDADFRTHLQDYGLRYDPTTGLPNGVFFREWLRARLTEAAGRGESLLLVWVDVLNLRREYSIGGDEGAGRLIGTVADSLRPWASLGEMACRYSDRCFLLALKSDECMEERLSLILDALSHRHMRGSEGKPEIAAGVACFPDDATNAEELIRFASLAAVTSARTRSRAAVRFRPEMNTALLHERELEKDLRTALRENQLTLVYQPQIDLVTGEILGVESLTRWNHPTRGWVSPAQFIPVAERSNLIDEIFTHSLRRLLTDAAEWRAAGIHLPSLGVNASPANVRHEEFVSIVQRELAANPPGQMQLDIEVTESLLMDDEALFVERLSALRQIGVKVSLDDFGTRYTGFNALKGLPLNTMKIDKCFVHGVDRSSQAQSLCRTIVMMSSHLRLSSVAEGIEDVGELQTLKRIGCQAGQGYLFQRPVPNKEFVQFLRDWPLRKHSAEFGDAFLGHEIYTKEAEESLLKQA
jgi:EAL domain-containing protein (putative c-di-GMP-specific phosphodiesterase class I)/GGDEF domain-containing protein